MDMGKLLQLLQPIESKWDTLAVYLLNEELHHEIDTIRSNNLPRATEKAFTDVLKKWKNCTPRAKRIWQTLCDIAAKHGDKSINQYMLTNSLGSEILCVCMYVCMHVCI